MGFYGLKMRRVRMGLLTNQMAINFIANIIELVKIRRAIKKNNK